MRKIFEHEIQTLKDDILSLGSMVEQAILGSVDALKKRDIPRSQEIYDEDELINAKRFGIESSVMIAIATQQPMAHDLRLLASILDVAGELERMGDYAKGIAKINVIMGEQKLLKPLVDLPLMAEKTVDMLHRALTAFIEEDVDAAESIPAEDDVIDALYTQIYRVLITYVIDDPTAIERSNWLLWVAHNLERVGDRVTNICERTIFIATGEMEEVDSSVVINKNSL
ncbi:MAG: phosphate signaling complex protein PhoU [Anaerolineae bacterium]|jgi:phosphate transport system protein|nr:phosphate signaling complex protein PhoU [Anaerolineae bacterium]MBT7070964.1 phosphate signaling complex protein PhoU [Anaerolineae bacterium]MBT7990903.1 phosphate signaling complex protein PhoU [Anaerolineae bacterium]